MAIPLGLPAALKAAHIGAETQDPLGGRIERGLRHPNRYLRDAAADAAVAATPAASLDYEASQPKGP